MFWFCAMTAAIAALGSDKRLHLAIDAAKQRTAFRSGTMKQPYIKFIAALHVRGIMQR